jgi:hypothetical protein
MLLRVVNKVNHLVELLNAINRCAGYACLLFIINSILRNGNVILGFAIPLAGRKSLPVFRQTRREMQSFPFQPDHSRHNHLKLIRHDQIKQKRPPSVEAVSSV